MDELRLSQRKRPVHVDEQVPIRRRNIRMTQDEAVSVPAPLLGLRSPIENRGDHAPMRGLEVLDDHHRRGDVPGRLDRTWMSAFRPPAEARQSDDALS